MLGALTSSTAVSRYWIGVACALASAIAFSWKAILVKLAYRTGVGPTTALGLRMAFALPAYVCLAWIGARRQPVPISARERAAVAALGLLGYYVASYLDFIGLTYVSAGLERLILFLYPSVVVLFAARLSRRRVAAREWQCMLLGYAGIACAFFGDVGHSPTSGHAWLGVLAVFSSSIAYAAYFVLAERLMVRLGSLRFTGMAMSCACGFSLLQYLFVAVTTQRAAPPMAAVYLCAIMAVCATVVPTLLLTEAIRRIGPGKAALCGMIGPLLTIGLEIAILGETANWTDGLGIVLVIASVVMLTRRVPVPDVPAVASPET